jgi:hypothetical protein
MISCCQKPQMLSIGLNLQVCSPVIDRLLEKNSLAAINKDTNKQKLKRPLHLDMGY